MGLPRVYDVESLCDHLSGDCGRPIQLIPMPLDGAGPCGVLLLLPDVNYVVYEKNTSQHHQQHIILHELAHLICGHRGGLTPEVNVERLLFPDLDPSLVRTLLGREDYSDLQEREAEIMAFLLGRGLRSHSGGDAPTPDPDSAVGRVYRSLDWDGRRRA